MLRRSTNGTAIQIDARFLEHETKIILLKKGKGLVKEDQSENSGRREEDLSRNKDDGGLLGQRNDHFFEPWKRIDLPLFNGDDAYAWIDKAERFFRMGEMPEEKCVASAFSAIRDVCLHGIVGGRKMKVGQNEKISSRGSCGVSKPWHFPICLSFY